MVVDDDKGQLMTTLYGNIDPGSTKIAGALAGLADRNKPDFNPESLGGLHVVSSLLYV